MTGLVAFRSALAVSARTQVSKLFPATPTGCSTDHTDSCRPDGTR